MRRPVVHFRYHVEDVSGWALTIVMVALSLGTFLLLWVRANQI